MTQFLIEMGFVLHRVDIEMFFSWGVLLIEESK